MRLNQTEVYTIARAMADQHNDTVNAEIKANKTNPKYLDKAKELFEDYKKIPKELRSMIFISRYSEVEVTVKSIHNTLINNLPKKQTKSSSDFENKIRLAALESADLPALKKKLKINF
jgi:hypothetical protein